MKLPKQIYYWAKKSGLKPSRYSGTKRYPVWNGQDRFWRVNIYGEFESSAPFPDFDRWANSVQWSVDVPKNEKQFLAWVNKVQREFFV